MNKHDAKLAAADIMDKAHDVLLETGVHCNETYKQTSQPTFDKDDTPNCLWQAVAIAMGGLAAEWLDVHSAVRGELAWHPDRAVFWELNVLPSWTWNDYDASVDDVFDVLLSSAKQLREEAAIMAAAESLPDMQSLVDSQVDV